MRPYTRSAPGRAAAVARTPTSAASTLLSMLGALGVTRASGLQRRPPGRRISPGVPTRAGLGTRAMALRHESRSWLGAPGCAAHREEFAAMSGGPTPLSGLEKLRGRDPGLRLRLHPGLQSGRRFAARPEVGGGGGPLARVGSSRRRISKSRSALRAGQPRMRSLTAYRVGRAGTGARPYKRPETLRDIKGAALGLLGVVKSLPCGRMVP